MDTPDSPSKHTRSRDPRTPEPSESDRESDDELPAIVSPKKKRKVHKKGDIHEEDDTDSAVWNMTDEKIISV